MSGLSAATSPVSQIFFLNAYWTDERRLYRLK